MAERREREEVRWVFTLICAVVLTVLTGLWTRRAELVLLVTQVTESVPAIPGVTVLVFLVAWSVTAGRIHPSLRFSAGEVVIIYTIVLIASSMLGCGIGNFFFSTLLTPFYFADPSNELDALHRLIPEWLVPRGEELVRYFHEGAPDRVVPWGAWIVPLLAWAVLFIGVWVCLLSIISIFRKQWCENERLTFPLVHLPLNLTERGERRGERSMLGDWVFWVGFSISAGYNLVNIGHAFTESIPFIDYAIRLNPLLRGSFFEGAWPMYMNLRPELIGFGYLVSLEVGFSIWFFDLFEKLIAIVLWHGGYRAYGMPYAQEQSLGAFVGIALAICYVARRHLKDVLRKALFGAKDVDDSNEAMPYRWALIGAVGGFVVICGWCVAIGLKLWIAAAYFGLIVIVAVVYAKLRAQVGPPRIWAFPFYQHKKFLYNVFGEGSLGAGGDISSLLALNYLTFMSRGYFPQLSGYQIEGFKMSERTNISNRRMWGVLLFSIFLGVFLMYWIHLGTAYGYQDVRRWGQGLALGEFNSTASAMSTPKGPNPVRAFSVLGGFLFVALLGVLRMVWVSFPLHPMGFAVATSYPGHFWGAFFVVWVIKSLVLKYGGARLYSRLIPGFIGLALGHFFMAGAVWGLLGMYFPDQIARYRVWFG